MKRISTQKLLILLLVFCLALCLFAGCNNDKNASAPPDDQSGNHNDPPSQSASRTVTFDLDGGTMSGTLSSTYKKGDSVKLPTAPTKSGHKFLYWDIEGQHYLPAQIFTMVDRDIQITAIWAEVFTVTVDFNSSVGTSVDYGDVISGDVITLPAEPKLVDHTFDGWSDGKKLYPAGSSYTIKGNVTFTAQFTSRLTTDYDGSTLSSSLSLNKINRDITINGYTANVHDQLDLQMDAFASSLLTRLATVWGWGLNYGAGDALYMEYITSKFVQYETKPNSTTPTEDFYDGVINTKNREIAEFVKDPRYNVMSPVHTNGDLCKRKHSDPNCPGCYAVNLESGYWFGVDDLGVLINLRNAIAGGTIDKFKAEPWQWTTPRDANLITIREFLDLYHTDAKQAIANIVAYGEDRGVDYETALDDINHLGFTEQDENQIVDFVLNTMIGSDIVELDNSRKPNVTEITRDTVFTAEEAKYKAYSLLVPCVVDMTVNEVFYDTQTNQATDTKVWQVKSLYEIVEQNTNEMQTVDTNYAVFKSSEEINIRHLSISFGNLGLTEYEVEVVVVHGSDRYEHTFNVSPTQNVIELNFGASANTYFTLGKYNGADETVSTQIGEVGIDNLGTDYILIKIKNGSAKIELKDLIIYN